MMIEWNVYNENFNQREMEMFNIFNHSGFYADCVKNVKKNKNKDDFIKRLDLDLKYYFWSRCEYEIVLTAWIDPKNNFKQEKIDVYDQVRLNWDVFTDYVWRHKDELKEKD